MNFGDRVKKLRKLLDLKQGDLADITGLSQGNISEIEAGKRGFSHEATVSMIRYLRNKNVSIDWLLTGEGEMSKSSPKGEMTEDIIELIHYYGQLSDYKKGRLIERALILAEGKGKRKSSALKIEAAEELVPDIERIKKQRTP